MNWKPLGTNAMLWEWETPLGQPCSEKVLAAAAQLSQAQQTSLPTDPAYSQWLLDLVPAYNSLALVFDTWLVKQKSNTDQPMQWVKAWAESVWQNAPTKVSMENRLLQVPVCYDPECAPDLLTAAASLGIGAETLVNMHSQKSYQVCFLGFLPGFPYMAATDPAIHLPRHAQPRKKVPAGSVGIAEWQTGIYPIDAPGGWHIIGSTPLVVFDPQMENPCFFQPGDQVNFVPISRTRYDELKKQTK